MSVPVISRKSWGAKAWVKGKTPHKVDASEKTEFFVHYHGAPPPASTGNAVAKNVEAIHLANGWAGVGYNFMVDQDGKVYEGRGWDMVGAHCPGHNRSGWGVYVAVGGDQEPSEAALRSVRALYDEACKRAGKTLAKRGHRDGKSTACPGDQLYAWVKAGMPVKSAVTTKPAPQPTGGDRHLGLREPVMTGQDVKNVQNALQIAGYPVAIDGRYGRETANAVNDFNRVNRISTAGVGPLTWAELRKLVHG